MDKIKIIAIITAALAITNIIAFALGWISVLLFWVIIIGTALVAFYIIPNMKKTKILKE